METSSERRKRRLQEVVDNRGGLASVAAAAGVSAAALEQILKGTLLPPKKDGTRSPRQLGDATARAIEDAFNLGRGWFDAPDPRPLQSLAPAQVAASHWRRVADVAAEQANEHNIHIDPARFLVFVDVLAETIPEHADGATTAATIVRHLRLVA